MKRSRTVTAPATRIAMGRATVLLLATALAALPACERPPAPTASSAAPGGSAAPGTASTAAATLQAVQPPSGAAPTPPRASGVLDGEAAGVHYLERVVGRAKPEDRLPMVVFIHGLGDRPESFLDVLDGTKTPARLVLPRGLDAYGGGWAWFPYRRGAEPQAIADGIRNAADKVAGALAELAAKRPTAGKPVVSGFSQGGMISFALAAQHPAAISAAYPLSGLLPEQLRPKAPAAVVPPPVVAFHGDADPMVPIAPARDTVAALKAHGWPAELREAPGVAHTVTAETRQAVLALVEAAATRAASAR